MNQKTSRKWYTTNNWPLINFHYHSKWDTFSKYSLGASHTGVSECFIDTTKKIISALLKKHGSNLNDFRTLMAKTEAIYSKVLTTKTLSDVINPIQVKLSNLLTMKTSCLKQA